VNLTPMCDGFNLALGQSPLIIVPAPLLTGKGLLRCGSNPQITYSFAARYGRRRSVDKIQIGPAASNSQRIFLRTIITTAMPFPTWNVAEPNNSGAGMGVTLVHLWQGWLEPKQAHSLMNRLGVCR
jgi:hypothetical protein